MRKVAITKLEKYMLDHIDQDNLVEVEKVQRYIAIVKMKRDLEKEIKENGVIIETINASQSFSKENPAINAWAKLESSMTKLLDTIEFKEPEVEKEKTQTGKETNKDSNVVALKKALL